MFFCIVSVFGATLSPTGDLERDDDTYEKSLLFLNLATRQSCHGMTQLARSVTRTAADLPPHIFNIDNAFYWGSDP